MAVINKSQFKKEFESQFWSKPQAIGLVKGQAQRAANLAQIAAVRVFEDSPVTKEIEAGVYSSNISNTISYAGNGNANLFTFIGFPEGSDPIEALRQVLNEPIEVQVGNRNGLSYSVRIIGFNEDDIENATPMPEWNQGASWALGIEEGNIPGIKQYLAKLNAGRSGGGLQVQLRDVDSSLNATPYISEIMNTFRERLQRFFS